MENNKNKIIGVIVSSTILTFLLACCWWRVFHVQQNELCSEFFFDFKEAIKKEKMLNIKRMFGSYKPERSPNVIPGAEKDEWCDQDYLFYRDSTRSFLDSLFRSAVSKQDTLIETAIRCQWEGRVIDTCSDSLFYSSALALESLVYRKNENPKENISLQPYVKYPFGLILKQSSLFWLIPCLWVLSLSGIIGIYLFQRRRKPELIEHKELPEFLEQELQVIPLIQDKTINWTKLSKDLLFDEKHGELLYEGTISVRLTENSLKIFCYFMRADQNTLTYEAICEHILLRSTKEKVSRSDRDAVANAIRHLRTHLKPIPVITIETLRSIGYLMVIPKLEVEQPSLVGYSSLTEQPLQEEQLPQVGHSPHDENQ